MKRIIAITFMLIIILSLDSSRDTMFKLNSIPDLAILQDPADKVVISFDNRSEYTFELEISDSYVLEEISCVLKSSIIAPISYQNIMPDNTTLKLYYGDEYITVNVEIIQIFGVDFKFQSQELQLLIAKYARDAGAFKYTDKEFIIPYKDSNLTCYMSAKNVQIINSYLIEDVEDRQKILELLYTESLRRGFNYSRSLDSWKAEWAAHNQLYIWNLYTDQVDSVDLDEGEPLWRQVIYKIISFISIK